MANAKKVGDDWFTWTFKDNGVSTTRTVRISNICYIEEGNSRANPSVIVSAHGFASATASTYGPYFPTHLPIDALDLKALKEALAIEV